jgi:hypothetical protein
LDNNVCKMPEDCVREEFPCGWLGRVRHVSRHHCVCTVNSIHHLLGSQAWFVRLFQARDEICPDLWKYLPVY